MTTPLSRLHDDIINGTLVSPSDITNAKVVLQSFFLAQDEYTCNPDYGNSGSIAIEVTPQSTYGEHVGFYVLSAPKAV